MAAPESLRTIPAVHRFLDDPLVAAYEALLGRSTIHACIESALAEARAAAKGGERIDGYARLRARILAHLGAAESAGLLEVINGTGVLLHTNFGRAPLCQSALEALNELAGAYTNLEYDIGSGSRGDRYDRVAAPLREHSGAEASRVVNNSAAAVLLVLDTFARNREVIVSRGQLIEIGGSFRLPDVLRKSGATLVEVGTTNKTYGSDYRNAWTPNTAMLMRTHASNYRVVGFTHELDARALAALAAELNVLSFEDLGSGALADTSAFGLAHEPTVAESIAAGIDLVAVSGDKLMGGPQCGVIFGRAVMIEALKRNPLLRALRVDKLTLAALGATLRCYQQPQRLNEIPLFAMLRLSADDLLSRAQRLCAQLGGAAESGFRCQAVRTVACTGGGTLPLDELHSAGLRVSKAGGGAEQLAAALRTQRPPVIGRAAAGALIIDLRTIPESKDPALLRALRAIA